MSTEQSLTPPAIGEVWEGQGGIYAGIFPSRDGADAYHMIIGDELGNFEWGPYSEIPPGTTLLDGQVNTRTLVVAADKYPAAQAAAAYEADSHTDFYLPAITELNEAWINLGDKPWGWLWSSSQREPLTAFGLGFLGGSQGTSVTVNEFRARAMRRVPLQ